ncbi:hypothetical protein Rsub_01385 [Raphidocelis subcapitata]|uniref:FAS1 domain-containing protein n=1 Tax=Raphidocelis subcapitata TaxID=307507 RepID=A0A2V0NMY2_9CHLO|nr:hypothetical protein Rsub_01385 [Raphidocelis subcapitata]|eukprot:GBF88886.1 hypothetical protein Rsub_01385 [Raphidocelis subcapitata]
MAASTACPRRLVAWEVVLALFLLAATAASAAAPAATAPAAPAAAGALHLTDTDTALEGAALFPQMSLLYGVIKGSPRMRGYLSRPGAALTAFPASDTATKALLKRVGKHAGALLQDEALTGAAFDFMVVPGRAWSVEELAAAAPLELATLGGTKLAVTRDPSAPHGLRVGGQTVSPTFDQATRDGRTALHILDGVLLPPPAAAQVEAWAADSGAAPRGAAALEAGPAPADGPGSAAVSGARGRGVAAAAAVSAGLFALLAL